jgi:hypothetical protein
MRRSVRQIEEAIKRYVKANNADPKPFTWSTTAQEILARVERLPREFLTHGSRGSQP